MLQQLRTSAVRAYLVVLSLLFCAAYAGILTLIDALSFSGARYDYALPAISLLVALAAIVVNESWRSVAARLRTNAT